MSLEKFRTAVSLHGHTLHSHENLRFLYNLSKQSELVRRLMKAFEQGYATKYRRPLDFTRAWWTPPLGPQQAWALEKNQLEMLGFTSLVSLTDHDNLNAPFTLRASEESRDVPVSFEWTMPYRDAELHVGIHNLPHSIAVDVFQNMAEYTRTPSKWDPDAILEFLHSQPGTLIVLNHPLWDEIRAGYDLHVNAVQEFLRRCKRFINALEWNGLRTREENLRVINLAHAWSKPVVSGGDRHGFEPNSVLNVTNAASFSEFAEEVRQGQSTVLLTPAYFQPNTLRIFQLVKEVMSVQRHHPRDWTLWPDRIFYLEDNDQPTPLSSLLQCDMPGLVRLFHTALKAVERLPVKSALQFLTTVRQPVLVH